MPAAKQVQEPPIRGLLSLEKGTGLTMSSARRRIRWAGILLSLLLVIFFTAGCEPGGAEYRSVFDPEPPAGWQIFRPLVIASVAMLVVSLLLLLTTPKLDKLSWSLHVLSLIGISASGVAYFDEWWGALVGLAVAICSVPLANSFFFSEVRARLRKGEKDALFNVVAEIRGLAGEIDDSQEAKESAGLPLPVGRRAQDTAGGRTTSKMDGEQAPAIRRDEMQGELEHVFVFDSGPIPDDEGKYVTSIVQALLPEALGRPDVPVTFTLDDDLPSNIGEDKPPDVERAMDYDLAWMRIAAKRMDLAEGIQGEEAGFTFTWEEYHSSSGNRGILYAFYRLA